MNPNTPKTSFNTSWRKYVISSFSIFYILTAITIINSPFVTMAIQHPRELYWAIDWQIEQTPHPITIEKIFSGVQLGIQAFVCSKRIDDPNYFTDISVDFYGYIQKILGKRICGDVLRLNNGHLTAIDDAILKEPISNVTNSINHISSLCEVTQSHNTPLLYISFPHKIHKHDPQFSFPSNNVNILMDCFCTQFEDRISSNNTQLYDARNLYLNNPKEHYKEVLKTSPTGRFFQKIMIPYTNSVVK